MATLRVAAKPTLAPMKVPQISKPGGKFEEAYTRMMSGKAQFRVVLTM